MKTALVDEPLQYDIFALTAPLDDERPAKGRSHQPPVKRLLGQELLGASLVNPEDLEAALLQQAEKGQPLGETLLEMGVISEEELLPFIETQLGVRGVRLRDGTLDPEALRLIPRAVSERLKVIGLFLVRDTLTVAMEDPLDLEAIDELERCISNRRRGNHRNDVRILFRFGSRILSRGLTLSSPATP